MSLLNFNDAEQQREGGLIPDGTVSLAVMTLRSGGHGEGGWMALSKSSGKEMLDVEFTLYGDKYDRRKVWKYMSFSEAAEAITNSQLRAALESAFKIDPADNSPEAMAKRSVTSYGAFNGLNVCIKIGIEKSTGDFPDKNTLRGFVTPDRKEYIYPGPQQISSAPSPAAMASAGPSSSAPKAGKPSWEQ